jgi:hypothetical protein
VRSWQGLCHGGKVASSGLRQRLGIGRPEGGSTGSGKPSPSIGVRRRSCQSGVWCGSRVVSETSGARQLRAAVYRSYGGHTSLWLRVKSERSMACHT